jgi:hypothetical protein
MSEIGKTKTIECWVCEEPFTFVVKKGRQPNRCQDNPSCQQLYRRMMRKPKPKVVRQHKCADCDVMITQTGKGRTIVRCEECRTKLRAKQNADYRESTFIPLERQQICIDCGCDMGIKTGRGKLKQRCDECQKKNHNKLARESAKKNYTPVVRKYFCAGCNKEFEQKGRGKLRKTCPSCKTENTSSVTNKSEETTAFLQQLINEKSDEEKEMIDMWKGMELS